MKFDRLLIAILAIGSAVYLGEKYIERPTELDSRIMEVEQRALSLEGRMKTAEDRATAVEAQLKRTNEILINNIKP
jgi:hypothetical protein